MEALAAVENFVTGLLIPLCAGELFILADEGLEGD